MNDRRAHWFDEAAGPLVRPYAVTRGRTSERRHDLDMITLVVAVRPPSGAHALEPEYEDILRLCQYPLSVAEISAKVHLPLAVTKILVGDLIEDGYLIFRSPPPAQTGPVDLQLLQAVRDGIRKL
ncbi:DUF742 domain-containing protein [Amycolatopsis acidicola]|uniref:DUF742 domain-containing protein n=1 Tax=Amycolatopsis acidicola TaxID=2596893 RepID=A0A5N0V4I6_9PSEU|nr:DUF742 domain-containing protein [Amycolatopsis acidicola]KAA9161329.1 DUF742 domain-containing protein [Amycolatopsis acidicola]